MHEDKPVIGTSSPGDSIDWEMAARYLAGESSAEEAERFRAFLASRPSDERLINALDAITAKMSVSIPDDIDVEAALQRVKVQRERRSVTPIISARSSRNRRFPIAVLAAAASVLIVVTGWLALREKPAVNSNAPAIRGYATGIGMRDSIKLSDGTLMVLGPASFASVANNYGTGERRVEVRGYAYFSVKHDPKSPFVVRVGQAVIRDVGTRFAVRSDVGDEVIVSVAEGVVSLASNDPSSPQLLLQAGQRGALRPQRPPERLGTGAIDDDLAWTRGQLVFRESPMSEVASSLKRWYGMNLRFDDRTFADRHITATFSGEPPERVIEVIRLALGAQVDRRGDTVVVRSVTSERGGTRSR